MARGNTNYTTENVVEHKWWTPKSLKGGKLYELVEAKGQTGYLGGRRVKGAFVVKDIVTGKMLLEVTPRKLRRLSRPVQGWIIARFPISQSTGKGGRHSLPQLKQGGTRAAESWMKK